MGETLRVLIVEDQEADAILIQRELRRQGLTFVARRVDRDEAMIRALREFAPDLVISDFVLPGFSGLEALAILRKECPGVPLIFVSGTVGEEQTIELRNLGATDFVLKDQLAGLPASVNRALRAAQPAREQSQTREGESRTLPTGSIDALPATLAHDLNNLLTPISMAASMLRGKPPDVERERLLSIIENSARRASEIVGAALAAGRGGQGERRPVELDRVMKAVFQKLPQAWPESLRVKLSVADDLWRVSGHAAQLEQAILDLCVGAGNAMPQGGALHLNVGNLRVDAATLPVPRGIGPGRYVVLEISDTGDGAGRDWSTAQGIVEQHGGSLHVASAPDGGTICKVYLPAATDAPRTEVAATAASTPPAKGRNQCILLVDDEETIRFAAKAVLTRHGYRVLTATDGADALKVFHAHADEVTLVLTDLMMPVMGGIALVQAVRQTRPGMAVVMSSGQNEKTRLAELEAAGIHAVLNKPYTADVLLHIVEGALLAVRPAG